MRVVRHSGKLFDIFVHRKRNTHVRHHRKVNSVLTENGYNIDGTG